MNDHNVTARDILARALAGTVSPSSKETGFLGQMGWDANPPSDKQARWLSILAERYAEQQEKAA